jgi:hypothetical protein
MALYEYERFDGTVISGLTLEQALEEEKKDKVLQQQQTADASLGPQISAGIHAYESSKGPQQPMQTLGNDSSSPMSALGSPGPSQNTNHAPNTTGRVLVKTGLWIRLTMLLSNSRQRHHPRLKVPRQVILSFPAYREWWGYVADGSTWGKPKPVSHTGSRNKAEGNGRTHAAAIERYPGRDCK